MLFFIFGRCPKNCPKICSIVRKKIILPDSGGLQPPSPLPQLIRLWAPAPINITIASGFGCECWPTWLGCELLDDGSIRSPPTCTSCRQSVQHRLHLSTVSEWVSEWVNLVMERSEWRSLCKTSIEQFESDHIRALEAKWERRKTATIRSAACYPCQICGQTCASRIGLYSHSRTHQHWLRSGIRRVDGPVQQAWICIAHNR